MGELPRVNFQISTWQQIADLFHPRDTTDEPKTPTRQESQKPLQNPKRRAQIMQHTGSARQQTSWRPPRVSSPSRPAQLTGGEGGGAEKGGEGEEGRAEERKERGGREG